MADAAAADTPLLQTPLHERHVALGARMVPFAGYAMPVQYKDGILTEHLWTRENAGLFDVSHMGQGFLSGDTAALIIRRGKGKEICCVVPVWSTISSEKSTLSLKIQMFPKMSICKSTTPPASLMLSTW